MQCICLRVVSDALEYELNNGEMNVVQHEGLNVIV